MRFRNPDRRGLEVVALMAVVLLALVAALIAADALHMH
jgi:hypothetical protein